MQKKKKKLAVDRCPGNCLVHLHSVAGKDWLLRRNSSLKSYTSPDGIPRFVVRQDNNEPIILSAADISAMHFLHKKFAIERRPSQKHPRHPPHQLQHHPVSITTFYRRRRRRLRNSHSAFHRKTSSCRRLLRISHCRTKSRPRILNSVVAWSKYL
ncbi:hypothetical protein M5K25_013661 [Dendrobium thyrsiflorum]|uniref:Uncharacterized protein n=1 Tax=Dendrobium thyrsiflorum TaxID=117978 RepID=A0ABD0UU98_DENTH